MRYLKNFNESNELDYEDIISDLKDILLEIEDIDDEFSSEISVQRSVSFVPGERWPRSRKSIFIKIKRDITFNMNKKPLFIANEKEFEILKDVINRIGEYAEFNDMIFGSDGDINKKTDLYSFPFYDRRQLTIILFPIN